jgi:hypothetical protein
MSTRSKAQAIVNYYDSANYSSTLRTAVVAWVNAQAAALNADATPKAFKRKYVVQYSTAPKGSKPGASAALNADITLTDSAKWDSTTRAAVVAWLQAVAVKLTNDATPKSFKRTQVFTFGR